ncbi:hypothetical protein COO60DRAFT_195781 [Scenedesmus sp. NREL 46B-D3]|nr:hypothetical protein COO60DRAFT_195781 [Scenedesmus sp. NREL 46B-D3]
MANNVIAQLLGPHWSWKKWGLAVLVLGLLLGIGLMAGYFVGVAVANNQAAAAQRATHIVHLGSGGTRQQLQQLPELGSDEAAALLADPDTPGFVRRLYVFANDSSVISEEVTVRFLRALKAAQEANAPPGSSTLSIDPFIPLARDLLNYFRSAFSAALLPLLRLFAASGGTQLVLTAVSPDVLQREVRLLLNTSSLNSYYMRTARGCGTRLTAGTAASSSLLADSSRQAWASYGHQTTTTPLHRAPTCHRFKLQAVRWNHTQHAYLNVGTLPDWQHCAPHPTDDALHHQGIACLQRLAMARGVARLADRHVINVFVSGSDKENYCSPGDEVCEHAMYGLAHADGPWWNQHADATWREGTSTMNWVWLRWTQLDPADDNRQGRWQAGGAALAHELGHYLGLMHTHEGECAGDMAMLGDDVPDTAPNMLLEDFGAVLGPVDLALELQTWCTGFRDGALPAVADLAQYNSCPAPPPGQHATDPQIDAVFNMMSYVPPACVMLLTPGQVARLQRAIQQHRPLMMAAYAAK